MVTTFDWPRFMTPRLATRGDYSRTRLADRSLVGRDSSERGAGNENRPEPLGPGPVAVPKATYLWTMIKYRDDAQNFSESGISNDPRKDVPSRSATFTSSRLWRDTI